MVVVSSVGVIAIVIEMEEGEGGEVEHLEGGTMESELR